MYPFLTELIIWSYYLCCYTKKAVYLSWWRSARYTVKPTEELKDSGIIILIILTWCFDKLDKFIEAATCDMQGPCRMKVTLFHRNVARTDKKKTKNKNRMTLKVQDVCFNNIFLSYKQQCTSLFVHLCVLCISDIIIKTLF